MKTKKNFKYYSKLLIFVAFVVNYFHVALAVDGTNVLIVALEREFGWTRLAINSATSAGALFSVVSAFIIGTLIMKVGIKKIMIPVSVLVGLDLVWMANTTGLSSFAASMIVLQILLVGTYTGSFALLSNWFIKKRGLILGIVTIGAPASSATFTPIATKLVASYGFRPVYMGIGIIYAVFGLLMIYLINEKPEDYGYAPDNADLSLEEIENQKKELDSNETIWTMKNILITKETWLLVFSWGLIYLMMTGIMSQLIPRFLDVGMSIDQALGLMAVAAILGMPMSYIWGWLDDKLSTPKTCIIFALVYVVSSACFIFASAENMVFAYAGVLTIALTTGGMPNLQPSLQAWVFGRKDYVNTNRYIGIGHMILRSLGFTVMGIAYARFGTYTPIYGLFIVLAIITAILFSMIKVTYDPERIKLMNKEKCT